MGKQKQAKSTVKATPWGPQGDAVRYAYGQAKDVMNDTRNPNATLRQGWDMARANVNDPNSGFNKSKGYYDNILKTGGYDENVWKNISSPIIAGVTSQFMNSGRTGSGLEGINLTNELTQAYAPFAVNQANMAAGALPMLDAEATNGLVSAGQQEYQYPWQNLQNYYGIVGNGNWGGTTVSKTPQPSMLQQVAGAGVGLLGSALGGGVFAKPQPIY